MDEVENTGVMEEVAAPETEYQAEAQAEQVEKKESDAELNFRRLREANERLQKEREHDRQMMMAMQEQLQRLEKPPVQESDEFADLDPSDWSTIEQAEKLAERIAERKLEQKFKEWETKRKADEMPQRLRSKFADIDSVVTKENVEKLQATDPELAHSLSLISDPEAQAVAAYKYIKTLLPQSNTEVDKRLAENANRPKSPASVVSKSPLSQAGAFEGRLTPEIKAALYKEMMECARRG